MHGYQIKTHIERNFGHMWSINFGQVYPSLKSLEKEGLIDMI
ncbi:MAG: PadR family transcriptional regulator, partial [Spirochaetes bacterium]|nr:PadR family transcriptional regulator [Spirochaetota bacterium]